MRTYMCNTKFYKTQFYTQTSFVINITNDLEEIFKVFIYLNTCFP